MIRLVIGRLDYRGVGNPPAITFKDYDGSVRLGGVLTALIHSNFFTQTVNWVASSITVGNQTLASVMPSADNATQLLSWSANTAYYYFSNVTAAYGHFWGLTIGLSIVPITSPFGWYLQQSTWYLQTMMSATIVNLGFIYTLSLIAKYAWGILSIAVGLLLIRQTRSIGVFIITLALIALFVAPLLIAYTFIYLGPVVDYLSKSFLVKPSLSDIVNFFDILWNQGFQAGLMLQTYDVVVDVVLAFALAVSIGIARVFGEAITEILPI